MQCALSRCARTAHVVDLPVPSSPSKTIEQGRLLTTISEGFEDVVLPILFPKRVTGQKSNKMTTLIINAV